jgi:hypothetical protein
VTSRELYLAACALEPAGGRLLEDVLRAVRLALSHHYGAGGVTPPQFLAALRQGFTAPGVPGRVPAWAAEDLTRREGRERTAQDVDRQLKVQILDLEDALDTGVYDDDMRSFGVNVRRRPGRRPGGESRWYNFGPEGFVECGLQGAFGGWEVGDGGRIALDPDDVYSPIASGPAPRPAEISLLTWDDIGHFLGCGQTYE